MLRHLLLISASCFVVGCSSVEGVYNQARDITSRQVGDKPDQWQAVANNVGEVKNGWVNALNDTKLSALVAEAQQNNRNLRAASLNVEKSWLLSKKAGAALSPQVNATLGTSDRGNFRGSSTDSLTVGLQANWELDVWGRIQSGKNAARASAEAAEADYRFAQLSVAAAVSRAYFGAVNAEQQAEISRDIVKALEKTQQIVKVQYDNGLASTQDLALSKANLANARDTLETAEAGKENALRALEVLIGRYPSAELFVGSNLPAKPAGPPAGLPSEILERRPDLIAAERRLAASINALNQAKVAQLPRISLTAGANNATKDLGDLLNPTNLAWTAASNLLTPVLDGGSRKTQVKISTVEQKAAVEAYADAALKAFSEVEQALADGQTIERRKVFLQEASNASDEALRIARIRYNEGDIDLLSVLQLEQAAFGARSKLITLQRLELEQYINLNLALGGDWKE